MTDEIISLELDKYTPEIDTFLDFKNRVVKKIEKVTGVSQNPDFATIFKNVVQVLDVKVTENKELDKAEVNPDEEKVRRYLEGVIAITQLFQEYHELFITPPPFLLQLVTRTSNVWIKLATEFLAFNATLPLIKDVEAQEKYYIVLPIIEKIMASLKASEPVNIEKIILLILVYKVYTTALQKNKFMDDVQDLFVLFVENIQVFDTNSWKNPLLDNFHRMLVQVGLMLKNDKNVGKVIEWRKKYLDAAKENLVHEKQDPNLVLNIINIYFSIAKNHLQLSDTNTHEQMLEKSGEWLDNLMAKYPFTKKAWKLKAKMIRSLGHNALKRGQYAVCYKYYLRALVVSYHQKLQREYDRALMYVNKYYKFFSQDHLPGLKEDLKMIPERLSRTHLLYLIGKSFTERKQFSISILVQKLLVEILEEEYNEFQVQLAVGQSTQEKVDKLAELQELLANNIDFLGNLLMRTRQTDAALETFKKEAALFENDKPRKQVKIYMKVAKEFSKNGRFKEALEFGEKAYRLASEHNISENTEKLLQFLVEICKLTDNSSKLADYKKLLYDHETKQ
nr:tetratricopeptide repeat protein [Candidatus Sigynarchaeota archaeon]